MIVCHGPTNEEAILNMYQMIWYGGVETEPRGQKTKNIRNLALLLDASMPVLTSFNARKLNLDYCKREWLWYLGADKFDASIMQHAKMWLKLQQADGSFHSNYGQYIFARGKRGYSQFEYCLKQLQDDPMSRRATMALLNADHLYPENTDVVCTNDINFCIEEGELHMTVKMRSNDVIFGFTNDAFCFHQLHQFMFVLLKESMPGLKIGTYTHISNSMHVYERHYEMIQELINTGPAGYLAIPVPEITAREASELIRTLGKTSTGAYAAWLHATS